MFHPNQVTSMHNFNLLTPGDVEKIIKNFPSKTCSLVSILTWLVKDNFYTLLPILTKVVNSSLSSGTFPDTLKQSIITPVLKKSSLDHNILKHYRPVANMWDRRDYTPKNQHFIPKKYRAKKKCSSQTIPPIGMEIGRNLLYSII